MTPNEPMKMRVCPNCKINKSDDNFHLDKSTKSGLRCYCKECDKKYKRKNKERIFLYHKEYHPKYYKNNKEKIKNKRKEYYLLNKKRIDACHRKYKKEHPEILLKYQKDNREKLNEYAKEYRKKKRADDPKERLIDAIKSQIYKALKQNKAGKHWENLIDYTLNDLKKHLEKRFKEGMTWNNYGKGGWEIDHIVPVSVFNFSSYKHMDFKRCWALDNLQPLWKKENLRKNAKLTKPFQPSLLYSL